MRRKLTRDTARLRSTAETTQALDKYVYDLSNRVVTNDLE